MKSAAKNIQLASYDDLFKMADQALYSVKEKGKNNYRMVSYKSIYKQK